MSKTLYVINPTGLGGAGIRAWKAFKTMWSDPVDPKDVIFTERPGHAREIAVLVEGYDVFAAVGGDGTVGELMSGIIDRKGLKPDLAIIPAGTGNDIARNVGIESIDDAVRSLGDGRPRGFDLIRIDSEIDSEPIHKYAFLHVCVGFSPIPMVKRWMKRLLGPKGAYYLGTLLQATIYRCPHMAISTEERKQSGRVWMVIVGNAEKSAGGSMCLSPGARIDDGKLNITIFASNSKSKLGMLTKVLPKVATGAHVNVPGISYFTGKKIQIRSDPPALLELDGDLFGTTPATLTVCPRILRVMTPDPSDKATAKQSG
jgi:diacylglycerol kinase (ATP)